MYLKSRMLYLYVETPLHAGAGSGLGAVDLPIQRERATHYPIVQASGLKGALRDMVGDPAEAEEKKKKLAVFGPDTTNADDHAGAFAPSDARILLFPVRSLKGVSVWATSIDLLNRWKREAEAAGISDLPALPSEEPSHSLEGESQCFASSDAPVTLPDGYVVLEEFAFKRLPDEGHTVSTLASWLAANILPYAATSYWGKRLAAHLVILPDEDLRDFLQHATEVLTRVRLEPDAKTVARGALWTEEHLPADSLLYAPARATRLRTPNDKTPTQWQALGPEGQADAVLKWVSEKIPKRLQLGGDETIGRGIVGLRWSGGGQ